MIRKTLLTACLLLLAPAAIAQQEDWSDAASETVVVTADARGPAVWKLRRGEAEIVPAPDGGSIARLTFVTPEAHGSAHVREVAAFRVSGTRP